MIQVTEQLASEIGLTTACAVLNVPRSSVYRARQPQAGTSAPVKNLPVRQLSETEREIVHTTLNSERFQDCAPRQVYAALLDDGRYLCSVSTLYRILAENKEIRERRDQLRHPNYTKPELLATAPNQACPERSRRLWSRDITRTPGPAKWNYYYLYVMLDIFSRYVVGWLIADCESSALAQELILDSCAKQNIHPDQLTIHADRGGSMIAKPVALLMADLGVIKSHSRPHVSNDNPFSESQFKTMKSCPEHSRRDHHDYPDRFGCQADARAWAQSFFTWYNTEHRHSGIGLMTPQAVHYGQANQLFTKRQQVLQLAYAAHPERFVKGRPQPPQLPIAVWINPPKKEAPATNAVKT